MNELIEFLTSKEIIVVYVVAIIACLLCFIVYIIDKNYYKRRQKHNTKELNKIVESVNAILGDDSEQQKETYDTPVIEAMEEKEIETNPYLITLPVEDKVDEKTGIELLEPEKVMNIEDLVLESIEDKDPLVEKQEKKEEIINNTTINNDNELQYTNTEPTSKEARQELMRITEELTRANEDEDQENIELTSYELEQEENAIISLDELLEKSKEMYESNELTQYKDEGNEPISLADLEARMKKAEEIVDEPVIIKNIEEDEPVKPIKEVIKEQLTIESIKPKEESIIYRAKKKFKNSPVISPIFGIEHADSIEDIELENTANYEKLDAELKKTNEFLMTLKELQKNLKQ